MKTWVLAASALLSFACSSEPGATSQGGGPSATEPTGELSLELLGSDQAGHPYRLRNATFDIFSYSVPGDGGFFDTHLSSDTVPDATSIRTRLLPGNYTVTLQNGDWFLEKVTSAGAERVEEAVLLSSNSQYAYVYDRSSTFVNFAFGVDGSLIDFRHGDLDISVSIEHPDDDAGGGGQGVDAGAP